MGYINLIIGLINHNGQIYLFEYKATCKKSDYFTILVILTQTVKVTNTVKITWHDDGLL